MDDESLFINGKRVPAGSGETAADINPATEEVICQVARATEEDVDRAVDAARTAFSQGEWARLTARERSRLLVRIGQAIEAAADDLALRESLDVGKPLAYAKEFEIANGTPYGLAAGLHTRDVTRAHRVAASLQAGIVWVNTWGRFEDYTPFGGYKASGTGRELGPEGLDEYLQYKTVYLGLDA
jgi:acyl-CoA reductase-like NAD-dependent aldehyde dehydrogenase